MPPVRLRPNLLTVRPALGIAAYVLQILAILSLILAVLPVLYPIVTGLGLFVFLFALVVLGLYPATGFSRGKAGSELKSQPETTPEPRRFSRDWIALHGTTRRAWRAARFSLIAVGLVLTLYTAMRIHSRFFYEEPLNRELDPLRETFRQGARTLERDAPTVAEPENTGEESKTAP